MNILFVIAHPKNVITSPKDFVIDLLENDDMKLVRQCDDIFEAIFHNILTLFYKFRKTFYISTIVIFRSCMFFLYSFIIWRNTY